MLRPTNCRDWLEWWTLHIRIWVLHGGQGIRNLQCYKPKRLERMGEMQILWNTPYLYDAIAYENCSQQFTNRRTCQSSEVLLRKTIRVWVHPSNLQESRWTVFFMWSVMRKISSVQPGSYRFLKIMLCEAIATWSLIWNMHGAVLLWRYLCSRNQTWLPLDSLTCFGAMTIDRWWVLL